MRFAQPHRALYHVDMTTQQKFPLGANVTLADLEGDVHPFLHRLRDAEPVSWLPALDAWLVTRRDLCIEVMRDAKTFTVDHPSFSTAQVVGPSMLSLDGDAHRRHRTPFEQPFRRREVESRFENPVAVSIEQLLDDLVPRGEAELRRDYAGPIAVQAMIAALGLAGTPIADVLGWYDSIVEAVTRVTAGEPVSREGRKAFAALRESLLPAIHGEIDSSLLATASGAATGLREDEIVSNAAVLLFGGIETMEGMIANAFYFLLTNPDVLDRVTRTPSLVPAAVEETLRLEPAASVVDRYATCDVSLAGALIRAGELVRVSLAGANRDPATFPNPDVFNPWRDNLHSHVAFAQGPHVCLGLHLARLEAVQALAQALGRLPHLRLKAGEEAQPTGLVFRKPRVLPVRWGV